MKSNKLKQTSQKFQCCKGLSIAGAVLALLSVLLFIVIAVIHFQEDNGPVFMTGAENENMERAIRTMFEPPQSSEF